MGHRYYTEEDISKFRRVKELKEQGLQLKAIRQMLKNGNLQGPMLLFENTGNEREKEEETAPADSVQMAASREEVEMGKRHVVMVKKGEFLPVDGKTMALQEESREQKSFRLQQLLKEMIADAIQSNNQEICQEIKETLLKELDYQFRLQEEREDAREEELVLKQEEHYQKIDELLRSYNQRGRKIKKTRREKELQKTDYEKKMEEETAENADGNEEKNKGLKSLFQKKKRSAV